MENKFVITITRQFGSLGRPIAKRISEILNINYYDRDIVEETSKKMNMPVSNISEKEESYTNNFFQMLLPLGSDNYDKQDEIFNVQKSIIEGLAEKENCIIVGRCADYIFRNQKNILNIYIYAPIDARFNNCINILGMSSNEATKMIYKVDKARNNYHKKYAKYLPDEIDNKHVMIDSNLLGIDGTAEILANIVIKKFGLTNTKSSK